MILYLFYTFSRHINQVYILNLQKKYNKSIKVPQKLYQQR